MELTAKEKDTLLDIAKKAIAAKVNNKDIPELNVDSESLQGEKRRICNFEKTRSLARLYRLYKAS